MLIVLEKLAQPPTTSGYQTQLSKAERYRHGKSKPEQGKAVIFPPEDTLLTDDQTPEGRTSWDRTYQITAYAGSAFCDTDPYDLQMNIIRADVASVLLAEIANGTNFGQTVQNCWEIGASVILEPNEMPGINLWFRFQYRTDQYDPYTLG